MTDPQERNRTEKNFNKNENSNFVNYFYNNVLIIYHIAR